MNRIARFRAPLGAVLILVVASSCRGLLERDATLEPPPRERVRIFEDVWEKKEEAEPGEEAGDEGPQVEEGEEEKTGVGEEEEDRDAVERDDVTATPDTVLAVDAATGAYHVVHVDEDGSTAILEGEEATETTGEGKGRLSGLFSREASASEDAGEGRFSGVEPHPDDLDEENPWAAYPGERAPPLTWRPVDGFETHVRINRGWSALHRHLIPERPLPVREIVWPEHARVVERSEDSFLIVAGWISHDRFSDDELRCEVVEPSSVDHEGPRVRLVADIERHGLSGATTTARIQPSSGLECEGSEIAHDRVHAFLWDVWMGTHRATNVGTQRLPPR